MPAKCAITGTTYKKTVKRSKSMQGTITRLKPNLQKVKIGNKKVKISARAMRTLKNKLSKSLQVTA